MSTPSDVFFAPLSPDFSTDELVAATSHAFDAAGLAEVLKPRDMVAVKQHFGEDKCPICVSPSVTAAVVKQVADTGALPFLTDTTTLYAGKRSTGPGYLQLMADNGYTIESMGCPLVVADGIRGADRVLVDVDGKHIKRASIASGIVQADAIVALTHVTGHCNGGLGATIKNLAMGCASRAGKLSMHDHSKPTFSDKKCTACGVCAKWCPVEAITMEDVARMDATKCIGCGECFTVCKFGAISFQWSAAAQDMQEKMADFVAAILAEKKDKCAFLSFAVGISQDCDCMRTRATPALDAVGVLAGRDPVALDQAAVDVVNRKAGRDLFREFYPDIDPTVQIRAAEALGVGTREYRLIEIT